MFAGWIAAVAASSGTLIAQGPARAIAIADAHPRRGTTGRYEMTVASSERTLKGVFLNSGEDYRAPDDLTLQLTLPAARALAKRFGSKPEAYLRGKHVVVQGAVRAVPIIATVGGFRSEIPRFARYQHAILINDPRQIISAD